jgi:hypothetical protein
MTLRPSSLAIASLLLGLAGAAEARPSVQGDPLSPAESKWVDLVAENHPSDILTAIRHDRTPWTAIYGGLYNGFFGMGADPAQPASIAARTITLVFEKVEVRRLWFDGHHHGWSFAAFADWYDETGTQVHFMEVRGDQAVLLRGEALDAPEAPLSTLRAAAWALLPASKDAMRVAAVTRGWESAALEAAGAGPLYIYGWRRSLARLKSILAQGSAAAAAAGIHGERLSEDEHTFWGSTFAGRFVQKRDTVLYSSSNAGDREEAAKRSALAERLLKEAQAECSLVGLEPEAGGAAAPGAPPRSSRGARGSLPR